LDYRKREVKYKTLDQNTNTSTGMSVAIDPHDFARLVNEVIESIGFNTVEVTEAYEEGTPVQQEQVQTEEDKRSFKYLQEKEDEAWEVARTQEEKIEHYHHVDRQYDSEEREHRSNSYRSVHEIDCLIKSWSGDLPIERFWFYSTEHCVDKTVTTPLYLTLRERVDYTGSSWYKKKSKSKYRAITVQLSRHVKERQYGRVFFGTETRYVPLGTPVPPVRRAQPVIGYIKSGNNKIYCKESFYRNPLKGVLFKHKGKSILKEPTQLGETIDTIFWNLELYRNDRELHPERNEGSVARSLFKTLKTDFCYNITEWVSSFSQTKLDQQDLEWSQRLGESRSRISEKYLDTKIEELRIGSIEFANYCRIIQRSLKRKYYIRYRKSIKIQRAYRAYVVRQWANGQYIFHWMST
jgi:hypothetical protein